MSDRLQNVGLLNVGWRDLDSGNTDAGSSDLDEEQHEAYIAIMNVADEAQMAVN